MYFAIVIGAGSAGLTVSIGLAAAGKKVLIVEKNKVGGECTWSGCVPSKTFISSSKEAKTLQEALEQTRKVSEKIGKLDVDILLENENIDLIYGEAKFINESGIEVDGKTYEAKNIIIATGSTPFIPPIEGLNGVDYLTNQNFFKVTENYKSVVMIGGGVISLELAFPLKKLGVDVTIIERAEEFLKQMDREIQEYYKKKLIEYGIPLILSCTSIKIEKQSDNSVKVVTNNGDFIAEKLFLSSGRAPNVENLDLEKANIEYSPRGIVVDSHLRTTSKNITAIGDVSTVFKFSHVANYNGEIVVRNLLFPFHLKEVDYSHIPWTIFGYTEVAKIGETDLTSNPDLKVYTLEKEDCDRSIAVNENIFILKIVCDSKYRITGAFCIGDRAGEIINFIQFLITNKTPFYKLVNSIQGYPTYGYFIRKLAKKSYIDYIKSKFSIFIKSH